MPQKHVKLPSEYNHLYSAILSGVTYINDNYTGGYDLVIIPLTKEVLNG